MVRLARPRRPPPALQANPGINDNEITWYVTDRLREGTIDLYSSYLLMHEGVRYMRQCYNQPAWEAKLGITGLLRIYSDCLTGMALRCESEFKEASEWFASDLVLLQEHRDHFLVNRLSSGSGLLTYRSFWQILSDLRRDYDSLPDSAGPYPADVFPYHFAAPERELLSAGSEAVFHGEHNLDQESSDLYIQLQTNRG